MVEQEYNYLDSSIQQMTEFFESRIENLEKYDSKKKSKKKNQDSQNNKKDLNPESIMFLAQPEDPGNLPIITNNQDQPTNNTQANQLVNNIQMLRNLLSIMLSKLMFNNCLFASHM